MNIGQSISPAAWYADVTPTAVSTWLARLRAATAGVAAVAVIVAVVQPSETFPLHRIAALIAASGFLHADVAARLFRRRAIPRWLSASSLLIDVVLLTGLLELSGGPSNPLSVIYAVQIALAAVVLGSPWSYLVGAWSVACYGVLISWHLHEFVLAHHRLIDFPTHLFSMWLAMSTLAEVALHFVGQASSALARREAQLEDMRQEAARTERLVALTTLAAGAAHELSTPLATIAIASRELARTLAEASVSLECAADAQLIREEVDRCQLILDQMSGRAGGSAAEVPAPTTIDAVLADVTARLRADQAGRLCIVAEANLPSLVVPRAGLVQVLLSLAKNAFDATDPPKPVSLAVVAQRDILRFVVQDEGPGMSPEALRRAGEPFYTTKEPGRGLGLGLFLARAFAERCGGSLSLQSGRGTTAILELPRTPVRAEVA